MISGSYAQLLKRFTELGPYIRETKCEETSFFFDCLAVCVSVKPSPESREFWGWWLNLHVQQDHFSYEYYFGLFDKNGNWSVSLIQGKENNEKVKSTLLNFYMRLQATLKELNIDLKPAIGFKDELIKITVS
ncbi:sigma factor-binding protein Crl [Candidatus Pantoea carbekii]|uniref:Sigma factor-binding protein Crl n=1 Tax=Candidatus Pantoea carbekii TaxID=1235990 RepID=U3U8Q1_9GAMM|nr:sigma factor-binding protein Crl [Candidatus Pantoea carbekii]AKC32248.1 curlin genes transcriptional activatory protein Crl [Candidatus Pantoea carbekii]BAO00784.1 curlin genes transcriptional activatory protein [Candidatus Pantoea carbekii]